MVEHAGALAELLHRTDARARGAQRIGLHDHARRPVLVPGCDLLDEVRDLNMRGTGLHAGRVEAEEAAVRFRDGLITCVRRHNFSEIPGQNRAGKTTRSEISHAGDANTRMLAGRTRTGARRRPSRGMSLFGSTTRLLARGD